MHTDNKAKGCHNCCHFWAQDTKYKGENYYTVSKSAFASDPVIIGKIDDLKGNGHTKISCSLKLDGKGFKIYKMKYFNLKILKLWQILTQVVI